MKSRVLWLYFLSLKCMNDFSRRNELCLTKDNFYKQKVRKTYTISLISTYLSKTSQFIFVQNCLIYPVVLLITRVEKELPENWYKRY